MDRWFRSAPQPTSLGSLIVPNLSPNKVLGEGPSRPRLLAFKKPRLIPGLFVLGGGQGFVGLELTGCVEVPLDKAQVKATVVGAEQGHFADGDLAQGRMGEYLALQVVGWARL